MIDFGALRIGDLVHVPFRRDRKIRGLSYTAEYAEMLFIYCGRLPDDPYTLHVMCGIGGNDWMKTVGTKFSKLANNVAFREHSVIFKHIEKYGKVVRT